MKEHTTIIAVHWFDDQPKVFPVIMGDFPNETTIDAIVGMLRPVDKSPSQKI